ncbi:uncharacterized protein LOC131886663 isoform X2 [Tigriopus californicus]|uniref:uncharacterized protein LOC131886663 isoform X2 n=1 Tax=Tigriopus californicus TaxID=6832 RepID=UPI0027DA25CF|nr:uncharacterized protein LOC131886663 isoform X2 [Tigriopus californicus]
MTTSAAASDKTVNKVALCSAIFAGVAYVGYSVARQAFSRRLVRNQGEALEYEPSPYSRRVYLRRLSGSEASLGTEALLGTLESGANVSHPGRLILRPLSVQERIRELNVRARHFAETILAIQLHDDRTRKASLACSRSLQSSPTRSRGILSPIDITHLGCASRCDSIENLAHNGSNTWSASLPPMLKKRWSRRSLKFRNSDSGMFSTREEQDEIEAKGERLLDEREAELSKRLQGFEDGTTKILTPYEAKSLVALLHSKDANTLEKALVTVSNSAAFTTNQDHLREAGAIVRLQHLLSHPEVCVQRAALTAVGNMALNTSNQKEMGHMVPILLPMIEVIEWRRPGQSPTFLSDGEFAIYPVLLTLTNIAALSNWHKQFKGSLTRLLDLTQSENAKIRMQSLRLLVNISTNEDMVQHLLAAKAPEYVWNMLDEGQAEDQLLRVITLLANLVCTAHKQNLDPTLDLPLDDDKTAEPDSIRFSHLYGDENRLDVLEHLESLMTTHPHEDIRVKARMIHNVIMASDKRNNDEGD